MKREIPGLLWIAIVALGVISLLGLLAGLLHGSLLVPLLAAACNVVLLSGLLGGRKWAYVLTIVFSGLGIAVALGKGWSQGLAVLVGNSVVLVPVLLCSSFFFPREQQLL